MMGRVRKFPPSTSFGSVGESRQEADALFDRLEQMKADTENQRGRKRKVHRYAIATTIAKALPLGPPEDRRERHPEPLRKGRLGATPVTTREGVQLAGFDPDAIDSKDPKRDMQAAVALQHALAWRRDPISLRAALKFMQRVRAWLAETEVP